jgi:hypothetical protein
MYPPLVETLENIGVESSIRSKTTVEKQKAQQYSSD